jgi:hypothetical protein
VTSWSACDDDFETPVSHERGLVNRPLSTKELNYCSREIMKIRIS